MTGAVDYTFADAAGANDFVVITADMGNGDDGEGREGTSHSFAIYQLGVGGCLGSDKDSINTWVGETSAENVVEGDDSSPRLGMNTFKKLTEGLFSNGIWLYLTGVGFGGE